MSNISTLAPRVPAPLFAYIFCAAGEMLNLPPSTPIEPVIVPGSAIIYAAGVDPQYPPDAAYPDMLTTAGFFRAVRSTWRRMSSDAITDPPGELTLKTTPRTSLSSRADLKASAISSEVSAGLPGVEKGLNPSLPRSIAPSP